MTVAYIRWDKVVKCEASGGQVMQLTTLGKAVNVASVPKLSPFRYPGGKTWLIPWIRRWLGSLNPRPLSLVETFAGGGAVSLTAVFEGLVDRAILVELDEDIAAVWETILGLRARKLAEDIVHFECTARSVNELLTSSPNNKEERAFRTVVMNRTRYGGIIAPGAAPVRRGENGRGISSRWYPDTLKKRILAIAAKRDKFAFIHCDGVEILRGASRYRHIAFFVDPPYTVAGQRLYKHCEVDHELLFRLIGQLSGDFLMTYDDVDGIRGLARKHGFDMEQVPMQNTKLATKTELLIGRRLDWARSAIVLPSELSDDALLENL